MPGRLAALADRALLLAAVLPTDDPARVARWLYRFGTAPREPEAERDFGPGDDAMAILGLTPGGAARRSLETAYEATTYPGWIGFAIASGTTGTTDLASAAGACKLYVSPAPDALAKAFPVIAALFARMEVRAFKVGRGLEGLLRPDKIIAYFDARTHLDAVATALADALSGCPVQGVPFTADAGADGLISWGIDPPTGDEGSSWRSWVTRRLATALVATRPATAEAAVAAARRAIAAAGVDPVAWTAEGCAFAGSSAGRAVTRAMLP